MDMLYRAYSNPLDLMNMYINRGRFGTFVQGFLEAEYERKKEQYEKNQEWMMWTAYIHSYSNKTFNEFKKQFTHTDSSTNRYTSDTDLDEEGALKIIDSLFPG